MPAPAPCTRRTRATLPRPGAFPTAPDSLGGSGVPGATLRSHSPTPLRLGPRIPSPAASPFAPTPKCVSTTTPTLPSASAPAPAPCPPASSPPPAGPHPFASRTWWPTTGRRHQRCAARRIRCSTPPPKAPAGCFSLRPRRRVWPGPLDPGPPTLSLSLIGGSSQLRAVRMNEDESVASSG